MSEDGERWLEPGDRERARRVKSDDDRGSGPIALAIVAAAAVSFALALVVVVLGALLFVYFFSAYLLAHLLRLVRFPLRRLLPSRRPPAALWVESLSPWLARAVERALRGWRTRL